MFWKSHAYNLQECKNLFLSQTFANSKNSKRNYFFCVFIDINRFASFCKGVQLEPLELFLKLTG